MAPQLDQRLAVLAGRQHGVVSHGQLVALGLGAGGITARVRAGRLHRLHRGVFAVGHLATTAHSRWLAAVLALGSGAVLSHRSAAALHGLRPTSSRVADVLVANRSGRARRDGLRVHRTVRLPPEERTVVDGIPVTTWARTMLDLAAVVDHRGVARALERAEELRLLDVVEIGSVWSAHRGHQGAGRLARALVMYEPRTKSELQRRFWLLCEEFGLPLPEQEVRIDGHPVDFLWREQRLVVETDGFRFHRTRAAWRRDREQDARLAVAGFTVLRPTWDDVTVRAAVTAERVLHLLGAGRVAVP